MNNYTENEKRKWSRTPVRAIPKCFFRLLVLVSLCGCEAPLDLSSVNVELAQPTHRSDLFQAAANYDDTIIVVGGMGAVIESSDGGNSWQRTTLADKPFLVDIAICPDGVFHAIDKTDGIWSRMPDGLWNRQALPEMTEPQALICDAANVLWVIGGFSTILHSNNSGNSWDSWSLDEDLYLTTIQFPDQQHGIATGEWKPGDQLPTVRALAVQLKVNLNTVSKAYKELEIQKVLETQQGTGTFIGNAIVEIDEKERKGKLQSICKDFPKQRNATKRACVAEFAG